jgi:hypothetical protein
VRRRPFLTARWQNLVLLNYVCPRALLEPLVPAGTILDTWQGETLVSLVGFLFTDTKVFGVAIPFHGTFEEVNLRFYVRRELPGGLVRRGVVFVRELVPRRAVAAVARWTYNEPYWCVPMTHGGSLDRSEGGRLRYAWRGRGGSMALSASVEGPARPLEAGSEAEFITEHYWGYTRQRDRSTTVEYEVVHPRWDVWSSSEASFQGAAEQLYGSEFARVLVQPPRSAFVAIGSEVAVYRPTTFP